MRGDKGCYGYGYIYNLSVKIVDPYSITIFSLSLNIKLYTRPIHSSHTRHLSLWVLPHRYALCGEWSLVSRPRARVVYPETHVGATCMSYERRNPRPASHDPASAAQAACCAPQRHLSSFATERKLVRAQTATRARATLPALPSRPQPPIFPS